MINKQIKSTLQKMKSKIKICYKNLLMIQIKLLKKFNKIKIMIYSKMTKKLRKNSQKMCSMFMMKLLKFKNKNLAF